MRRGQGSGPRGQVDRATPRTRSRFGARFPGFSVKPTAAFWVFMGVVPLVGVAALNTGNNALYLLLALTLGSFVASGAFSRHTLSRLRVSVSAPAEAFAGMVVPLRLTLANRSGWVPAAAVVCRLVGMPGKAVVARVPARGEAEATLPTVFARRGRHHLPAVQVEVRLPLAFFVKSVRWPQDGEVLVYPRRVRVGIVRRTGLERREEATAPGRRRRGGEVEQLREFRPGDDRRDIHWKQTARQQRFIVMERRERALPSSFLALDHQLPRRDDTELRERFEDLVSEVASSVLEELHRGEPVGLIIGGAVTPPGAGRVHARRLLERLALVQPVGPGEDPLPPLLAGEPVYRLAESG
ncbi:MAG TPA: DUF58 domain-containing protein [Thermoanaerobaculaceae bacterium]|nr:DUF58 domain-containing protein [Thermoanaerobaculaceae bacterium]